VTDKEFDNIAFSGRDSIVVRQYFRTFTEKVENVDFTHRTVNGYAAAQIVEYVKHNTKRK